MNTVKSDIVYSPQAFLEDLLGKCYFFRPEKTVREQVDKLIKANGKEPISFSLSDTEKAIKCGKSIVLVDCCDYSYDRRYIPDYRWYAVPENFGERNLKT